MARVVQGCGLIRDRVTVRGSGSGRVKLPSDAWRVWQHQGLAVHGLAVQELAGWLEMPVYMG